MKSFLKSLRTINWLNQPVRYLIRYFLKGGLIVNIMHIWPVFGKVAIRLKDYSFQLICKGDDAISNKYYYRGFSSLTSFELEAFASLARRSQQILDIGANIGLYSIISSLSNPTSKIHAFEPSMGNHTRLLENIKLNQLKNIQTYQLALSNENRIVQFFEPKGQKISDVSSLEEGQVKSFTNEVDSIDVQCRKLDDWIKDIGINPGLIKLDVELHELSVLQGAEKCLSSGPLIFMENHNFHIKTKSMNKGIQKDFNNEIENLLRRYNYFFYAIISTGIYRIDSLQHQPGILNTLLVPHKSSNRFYSKEDLNTFIEEVFE